MLTEGARPSELLTETNPMETPFLSIASTVVLTGSAPGSSLFGTSLNMYSAGNSIVSLSVSFVRARR